MYAVIQTGGKQYRVKEGDTVRVEKLAGNVGDAVTFDRVLMVKGDPAKGNVPKIGTPLVEGASVAAEIKTQDKLPKIIIFKMKRRKNYRRKNGHRQHYTELKITGISA